LRSLLLVLACSILSTAQSLPPGVEQSVDLDLIVGSLGTFADAAMAVTPTGEVYFAGVMEGVPDDVTATLTAGQPGEHSILIVKMDAALDRVLYKTILGGSETEFLRSIAVAETGELYLTGITRSDDFPSTIDLAPPLFQSGQQAFVVKLNAAGNEILYSTLLGGGVNPGPIAVDAAGAAYLGGVAVTSALPTTPGVLHPFPNPYGTSGFLAKLDSSGGAIDFATAFELSSIDDLALLPDGRILLAAPLALKVVNSTASAELVSRVTSVDESSVAADDAGNLYVAGSPDPSLLAVQKFSPDGTELLFERTFLGWPNHQRSPALRRTALVLSDAGRVHLFHALATNFPTLHTTRPCMGNVPPPDGYSGLPFDQRFDEGAHSVFGPDGATLYTTFDPLAEVALRSPLDGTILALRLIYRWIPGVPVPQRSFELVRIDPAFVGEERPVVGCVGHGGTFEPLPLSPGALMVLFGSGLGPVEGVVYGAGAESVPLSLADTTVTVDGVPAPVVYTEDRQINFLTPWRVRTDGAMVSVCVHREGEQACIDAATAPLAPGIVSNGPQSLAWNEDATMNEVENPASLGSILTLYVVGAGTPEGPLEDGAFRSAGLVPLTTPLAASFLTLDCKLCPPRFVNAQIVDVGSAPYHLLGITRVRVRVPAERVTGTLLLRFTVGDQEYAARGTVTIR
jgi:uncharacterized protein (TIGR03437 family)